MVRKIIASQAGTAIMEFALILPLFVFAVVGGMELAWTAVQQQKVQRIAATTADNASRVRGAIDETDIHEIMTAVRLNGGDLDFEHRGRVIISSIQRNPSDSGDWIRWQRCMGEKEFQSQYGREGKGRTDSSLQGVGKEPSMRPPPGIALIIAEVAYDHEPLVTDAYFDRQTFDYETTFIVRDRNDLGIGNVTELPNRQKLTC